MRSVLLRQKTFLKSCQRAALFSTEPPSSGPDPGAYETFYNKLGTSNYEVGRVGLGAMSLSLQGRPPEQTAIEVIQRAVDLGVTFIDTADSYCLDQHDMGMHIHR